MKKCALLLAFHASTWAMELEKTNVREVPSLVQLCANKLTAMPRQKNRDAQLAYCLSRELFSAPTHDACNKLSEELFYHYEHLLVDEPTRQSYKTTSLDRLTHTYHCTSSRTLDERLQRHTHGIQMLITYHEHVDLAASFARLLKAQPSAQPYELISVPQHPQEGKSHTKNLYALIASTGAVSILQHTSPTPISFHATHRGLLTIEKQQNTIEQTITISHILFGSGTTITKQFTWTTLRPPIISVAPNSGSFVRIDRQEKYGLINIEVIRTDKYDMPVNSYTTHRHYHIFNHVLASKHSLGKNWYISPSEDGLGPTYAECDHTYNRFAGVYANSRVSVWNKEGKFVFNAILPKHAGAPLVTFFDKNDQQLHCITMNKHTIMLHSLCLPTPTKLETLTKLAELLDTSSDKKNKKHAHKQPGKIAGIISYIQKKCAHSFSKNT